MASEVDFYTHGARQLQDQFDTRRLADRLKDVQVHAAFTVEDRALIQNATMFFLATASTTGQPECSYKGGPAGFVRILDGNTLAFPDYNGNGMFRTLGNVRENPKVALLFVDFEQPQRLRINGTASVSGDDPLMASFPGAQLLVRVQVCELIPNCPRYVHPMRKVQLSVFCPREGHAPPVPDWKRWHEIRTELPRDERVPAMNLRAHVRKLGKRSGLFAGCLDLFRKMRMIVKKFKA